MHFMTMVIMAFTIEFRFIQDEIKKIKSPDKHHDPKGLMSKYYKLYRGKSFEPMIHLDSLLVKFTRVNNLRRSNSFARFYLKLTGNIL